MNLKKNELKLTDTINKGEFKGKTIQTIIDNNKKDLFKLCQLGYQFNEEVYDYAGYKHTIRDINAYNQIIDNKCKKEDKVYPKESESLYKILRNLLTIEKAYINENNNIEEITEDIEDE